MPAQWFDRGLLIETPEGVQLAPLGEQLAARLGVSTSARASQPGCPTTTSRSSSRLPTPFPVDVRRPRPGPKRIEVSIADQRLRAYEGDTLVLETLVSTGVPPNRTPRRAASVSATRC